MNMKDVFEFILMLQHGIGYGARVEIALSSEPGIMIFRVYWPDGLHIQRMVNVVEASEVLIASIPILELITDCQQEYRKAKRLPEPPDLSKGFKHL